MERTDKSLFDCVYWWRVVFIIVKDEIAFKHQNILLPCTGLPWVQISNSFSVQRSSGKE